MNDGEVKAMKIRRGDILYADLGTWNKGSIQGGLRPVIVVSNDKVNQYSTVLTIVPLSGRIYKKRNLPTHVFVSADYNSGLDKHSIALCEQVTALPYDKVIAKFGSVNEKTLERIIEAVQIQIGVFG